MRRKVRDGERRGVEMTEGRGSYIVLVDLICFFLEVFLGRSSVIFLYLRKMFYLLFYLLCNYILCDF